MSRGRTTNEQVTGKFRTGVNPFDVGCIKNWKQIVFSSLSPSYIEFRNKQAKKREYLETRLLLELRNKSRQKLQIKDKIKYVSDQDIFNNQYNDNKQKYKYQLNEKNFNNNGATVKMLPPKHNQYQQQQQRHQSEEPQTTTTASSTKFKSLNLKRPPSTTQTSQNNANVWEDRKAVNSSNNPQHP